MTACCSWNDVFQYETDKIIWIQSKTYGTIKWFFHVVLFSYIGAEWQRPLCGPAIMYRQASGHHTRAPLPTRVEISQPRWVLNTMLGRARTRLHRLFTLLHMSTDWCAKCQRSGTREASRNPTGNRLGLHPENTEKQRRVFPTPLSAFYYEKFQP